MKRLFKRSLALLLALTMVLGNTLSMTSAAPVSMSGGVTPRIVTRAEAEEEKETGAQEEETPEIPENEQKEEPEQDAEEGAGTQESEPTEPEKPEEGGDEEAAEGEEGPQEPVDPEQPEVPEEDQEPVDPEQEPEEDQKPEEPEQENPEEGNPEIKDPEEQDPETETPVEEDPEVQDPNAQKPAEDEPEQEEEEDTKADSTEEEENDDEAADDEGELPDNDMITEAAEFYQEIEVNGVVFVVTADEGVLPDGTYAEVELVEDEAVNEALLEKAGLKDEEAPVFGAYRITLVNDEYEITESAARKVKVAIYGVEMLSENSELFEVGEENHIPTDVYKIEEPAAAPQNGIMKSRMAMPETASLKVRNATESPVTKADKEAGIDGEFMLGGTSGLYGVVMSGMPEMLNMDLLIDMYADETVTVKVSGVAGVTEYDLPIGSIAENAPVDGNFAGYDFVNATLGENGVEVEAVGVYQGKPYYSINGIAGVLLKDNEDIWLHYESTLGQYNITYDYDSAQVNVAGRDSANGGETITFTAKANTSYRITSITVNGGTNLYQTGKTEYTAAINGETTIKIVSGKIDKYTVTVEKIEGSEDPDSISGNVGVDDNNNLTFSIHTKEEWYDSWEVANHNHNLLYITVNGKVVEAGKSEVNVDGMTVSVSEELHPDTYNIVVNGVNQDLSIGYFIKDEKGRTEKFSISFLNLDGVTVYEADKDTGSLSLVEEGDTLFFNPKVFDDDHKYFYVKVEPGYEASFDNNGEGFKVISRIDSVRDNPGYQNAKNEGCQFAFSYTCGILEASYNPLKRTVSIKSQPIEYTVNYVLNGGNGAISDNESYTITDGNNVITLSDVRPEKDGSSFNGWKINGSNKIYQPGDTFVITKDTVDLANDSNEFVFTAEWTDGLTYPFTIVHEYEDPDNKGQMDQDLTYKAIDYGAEGSEVIAVERPKSGYILDIDYLNSQDRTIKSDGTTKLVLRYWLDGNDDGMPDSCSIEATFTVENGIFTENGGTTLEKTFTLTNDEGEWDANGSYNVTSGDIPALKANEGYAGGAWEPELEEGTKISKTNKAFKYSFAEDVNAWVTITFQTDGNGSFKNEAKDPTIVKVLKDSGFPKSPDPEEVVADAEGTGKWVFDGWDYEFPATATESKTYTAKYARSEDGDEVPDKYQIKATFTVENGIFTENGEVTLEKTFTLTNAEGEWDANGSYNVTSGDIPALKANEGYAGGEWSPELKEGTEISKANKAFRYSFAKDTNAWATVTFSTGEGGSFDVEGSPKEVKVEVLKGETLAGKIPTPKPDADYAFLRWDPSAPVENAEVNANADYTATFGKDDSGLPGVPDEAEVAVTFESENGKLKKEDGTEDYTVTRYFALKGDDGQYSPAGSYQIQNTDIPVAGTPDTGYLEKGTWAPDPVGAELKAGETYEYTFTFDKDETAWATVTFSSGEHGSFAEGATEITVDILKSEMLGTNVPEVTAKDHWKHTGWKDEAGNTYTDISAIEINVSTNFTAVYEPINDENHDGVPDEEETQVALRPYATTIYTGGQSNYTEKKNAGFPELELELKYGTNFADGDEGSTRVVDNSLVTKVNINGKWLESSDGEGINKYLEAIYVYPDPSIDGGYRRITDDSQYRADGYIAVIAVKDTALEDGAFTETKDNGTSKKYEPQNGFILNTETGRFVTISESSAEGISSIGVEAHVGTTSGPLLNYFVNIETSELFIREVNNETDTIREMVNVGNEAAAVAHNANDRAAAMPGEPEANETVAFYTNGDRSRAEATAAHVKLLVDDVKDEDNRRELIEARALEDAYKMSYQDAKAEGYDSQLKFLDLVDTQNGNAWVESATGTYVYWPYPEGTDENTEFTIRHFEGLDRETNYDGASAVATAIEQANLEDEDQLLMTKTSEGIRFFTDGKLAFSPFILMWKTDDTPGGGDHGGSTGPTPVSITNSGNPEDNYYTVGVNGQWVHMDNVDMNTPLDEAVPSDATAIGAPEWHRWRFYLANGTMLYNQWGHIENPYAVDGQPRSGWFYFDENGLMRYGWYLDARSGDWYYMHSESDGMLGTMITGWHYDTNDGKWYYLDPATGAMKTGWQQIDGKWYYFNPTPVGETWTQDQSTSVWRFNGNTVRPYGSMYRNEMTPDGYYVDADGVWVQ